MATSNQGGGELEWNSNMAVMMRTANTILAINNSRYNLTQRDDDNSPLSQPEEMLSHLICLYKEISVELTEKEKEVWPRLKSLRDKLRRNPPKPTPDKMQYWQRIIDELDDLDLELRQLAKRRGFLASNKLDVSKAGLRR